MVLPTLLWATENRAVTPSVVGGGNLNEGSARKREQLLRLVAQGTIVVRVEIMRCLYHYTHFFGDDLGSCLS
jgi:hypothetical protein